MVFSYSSRQQNKNSGTRTVKSQGSAHLLIYDREVSMYENYSISSLGGYERLKVFNPLDKRKSIFFKNVVMASRPHSSGRPPCRVYGKHKLDFVGCLKKGGAKLEGKGWVKEK